jgi:hypothetical protein
MMDTPTALISDSFIIEERASDILADALNGISMSQLYLVVVGIKSEHGTGELPRLDIIQLRTKEGIYTFKVQQIFFESIHMLNELIGHCSNFPQ